jgi:hypothetical protein
MGLLDGLTDPQSMATLQLAAGLLSPGSFGQGLGRGLSGYQQTLSNAQDIAAKAQAMRLQQIQMAQQQRIFDLQTPFLEEAFRRMQSGPAASPDAQMPAVQAALAAGAQAGSVGPTVANAQRMVEPTPQQVAPRQSMFPGLPDDVAFGMIGTGGFAKIPEAIMKNAEPTGEMKNIAAAYGMNSPQYRAALQAVAEKAGYIAPVNARPGSILRNPVTMQPMAFNPHVPEGGTPVFDASGNVVSFQDIPGATKIISAAAAAKAAGEGTALPYAGFDSQGRPLPVVSRTRAATQGAQAPSEMVTPEQQAAANLELIKILKAEIATEKDPGTKAAFQRELSRVSQAAASGKPFTVTTKSAIYAAPPLGAEATANTSAKDAVESWNAIHTTAQNALRSIGLLQTIQQLADKTMIGPGADKLQFINGVLNTLGIKPGMDQAQNYQIMKKNLNMLVGSQRVGAGGGGTDALQALLEASNPNVKEMNGPAAKEAAEELIAYQRMMIAKDRALPNPNTTSTQDYQAKESELVPFSDPRLWQLEHAASDQERLRILSLMPESQRASFIEKARQARKLGLFD